MHANGNIAYINGKIFTADDANPYAEAMLVENGRIAWVGPQDQLPAGSYETVDLQGKRVIPGFVDAHMHPVMLADFSKKISSLPPKVHSIQELKAEIRRVREEQGPGKWIEGWGYDEGKLAEGRSPTRWDLDEGCSDSPVSIIRTCGHIRCVNSKALELAGITKDTPDPQGGKIDRDENGEPTGVLRENARNLVTPLIPETTEEQKVDLVVDLGQLLSSQGITAICDMGNLDPGDNYGIYTKAVEKGFAQKVGIYYMWDFFAQDNSLQLPQSQFDRSQQIFAAGLKLIGDGSVSGRTAWMNEPYLGSDTDVGLPVCSDELIESALTYCKEHQCQLSMHAMGGRAIDRIVDRVYGDEKWTQGDVPHLRLEHVTEPSDRAISRCAEKGIAVATQPIFLYAEIESYRANLAPERIEKAYPVKTMLERGVPLCFSTDAPATSWAVPSDPFPCIKGGVTRKAWDGYDCGQGQAVDIETAIRLYTREAAMVAGIPEIGQLKAGYHADFAVLSEDILAVEPERIDQVYVLQTYSNGLKIYDKEAAK